MCWNTQSSLDNGDKNKQHLLLLAGRFQAYLTVSQGHAYPSSLPKLQARRNQRRAEKMSSGVQQQLVVKWETKQAREGCAFVCARARQWMARPAEVAFKHRDEISDAWKMPRITDEGFEIRRPCGQLDGASRGVRWQIDK